MFGSPQPGILDPLRGFVGGGARSDVFNQGLQKLNALFNIDYYLNVCNIYKKYYGILSIEIEGGLCAFFFF